MAWDLVTMMSALLVIFVMSIAFRDNILYKFAERTVVGLGIGIIVTNGVITIMNNAITPISKGQWLPIVAVVLGLMLLAKFIPGQIWITKYPLSLILGLGLALFVRSSIEANILGSIRPLMNTPIIGSNIWETLGNTYAFVGLIGGLTYFVFADRGIPKPLTPLFKDVGKIGRYVLMMYMGVSYAVVLLGRETLLLERVLFILRAFQIVP